MKSKLLLLFFLVLTIQASAQYYMSQSTATYSDLVGATPLTYRLPDSGYYFSNNYMFRTFEEYEANFNLQSSNPVSLGGFMDHTGFLAVYDSIGKTNTVVFQAFDNLNFRSVTGTTVASMKLEGSTGNRILKCEWKNLTYLGNTNQTASFQIWLHEADGSISYHYGPNTLPPATSVNDGGWSGILVLSGTSMSFLKEINLEGSPSAPQIFTGITTGGLPTLDTIPRNGTVYTFHRNATSVASVKQILAFTVYPNPAKTVLQIRGNIAANSTFRIYNNAGRLIEHAEFDKTKGIDISRLRSGYYTIQLQSGDQIGVQHFVKE